MIVQMCLYLMPTSIATQQVLSFSKTFVLKYGRKNTFKHEKKKIAKSLKLNNEVLKTGYSSIH